MTDPPIEQEAHDINNLLAGVIWTAQVMRGERDRTPQDREDLDEIMTAAREVAERVERLVDRAGRTPSQPTAEPCPA